jgi:hypothetical protein
VPGESWGPDLPPCQDPHGARTAPDGPSTATARGPTYSPIPRARSPRCLAGRGVPLSPDPGDHSTNPTPELDPCPSGRGRSGAGARAARCGARPGSGPGRRRRPAGRSGRRPDGPWPGRPPYRGRSTAGREQGPLGLAPAGRARPVDQADRPRPVVEDDHHVQVVVGLEPARGRGHGVPGPDRRGVDREADHAVLERLGGLPVADGGGQLAGRVAQGSAGRPSRYPWARGTRSRMSDSSSAMRSTPSASTQASSWPVKRPSISIRAALAGSRSQPATSARSSLTRSGRSSIRWWRPA